MNNKKLSLSLLLTLVLVSFSLFLGGLILRDVGKDVGRLLANTEARQRVRASIDVLKAMQALRNERGHTLRLLRAPQPPSPDVLAPVLALRAGTSNVSQNVEAFCQALTCAPGLGASEVRAALDRVADLRRPVDAALAQELGARPAELSATWSKETLNAATVLVRLGKGFLEALRAQDSRYEAIVAFQDIALAARGAYGAARVSFDALMAEGKGGGEAAAHLRTALGQLDSAWTLLRERLAAPGAPVPLQAAAARVEQVFFQTYIPAILTSLEALEAGRPLPLPSAEMNKLGDQAGEAMDGMGTAILQVLGAQADAWVSESEVEVAFGGAELLVALLLSVGGIWVVRQRVSSPLHHLAAATRRVAEGDLTGPVPFAGRGDEVGALADALVTFKENAVERERLEALQVAERTAREHRAREVERLVSGFGERISDILGIVNVAASDMKQTAQSMAGIAEQTQAQSGASAAAAEQTSANVQTVAAAAEQMAASIHEISRIMAMSSQIVSEASHRAGETTATVEGLAEAVGRIGEVVALIQDIAAQTNLLALNATIEAARAGDVGKGFAVVAHEVKALATQTARATGEISGHIAAVEGATSRTVEAIGAVGGTISRLSDIATTIASAIEEQSATTAEISRNAQEAASGTREVSLTVTRVSDAATRTGEAGSQVLGASEAVAREAQALHREIDVFLSGIRSLGRQARTGP
ncbi:methyl-accepting chemotaxis protein [Pararhodospirillum photometricum]|uniref:methyl-accepting chemotaxis protein n=1 Tax=Pararhodospirillum photometricum TaxID=1084 RepID=UPI0002DB21BD|nr:methyl-accepting chemotaxis protein [Pararhodospirillum photometricum]